LLDLLGFSDADFACCTFGQKTLLALVIFLDLLLFAGLLKNNLQLLNPP
jgi:hypothetical protein